MLLSGSSFVLLSDDRPLSLRLYQCAKNDFSGVQSILQLVATLSLPGIQPDIDLYFSISGGWVSASKPARPAPFYPSQSNSLLAIEFCANSDSAEDPAILQHGYALLFTRHTLLNLIHKYAGQNEIHSLSWTEWGPRFTRLLRWPGRGATIDGSVFGSRYARRVQHVHDTRQYQIEVFDFNPYAINCQVAPGPSATSLGEIRDPCHSHDARPPGRTTRRAIITDQDSIGPNELLAEAVNTSLPYVQTTAYWPFDPSFEVLLGHENVVAIEVR